MNIYYWLRSQFRIQQYTRATAKRYKQLIEFTQARVCKNILEIGVLDGKRALEMIEAAKIHCSAKEITYFGFDLFDLMTEELCDSEFSLIASRQLSEVKKRLDMTDARVGLERGFTTDTLPEFITKHKGKFVPDLVFLDGGHSVETIAFDWSSVLQLLDERSTVIFDDFYVDAPQLTEKFGCNQTIEAIDKSQFKVEILPAQDEFQEDWGMLKIRMVAVCPRARTS